MAHYDFKKDLNDAKQFEREMKQTFLFKGYKVSECNNGDCDLIVENKNKILKFELKHDIMAEKTNNIAIEFESRGKPSGINRTKADFYLIKFGNTDTIYLISVDRIKELIESKKYFRIVSGGDEESNTKMYLFNVITIAKNSTILLDIISSLSSSTKLPENNTEEIRSN